MLIALAAAQSAVMLAIPVAPVISVGLWWNANTISHNFIHRPFFRHRWANWLFAAYLSLLLGIPQSLWRDRHLAHHAGVRAGLHFSSELALEVAVVLALWIGIASRAPAFFLSVYLPGYLGGLVLCWLHGHYEHAHGDTSHYGKLYNLLMFNDGYHAEHHAHPGSHWSRLPEHAASAREASWPAPLGWLEPFNLEGLERLVLRSPRLQRFVLRRHRRAFGDLLAALPVVKQVAIVGGGLFPRTALILRAVLPAARLTIIDANGSNLDVARSMITARNVEFVHACFQTSFHASFHASSHAQQADAGKYDLVVIPLSFKGDRSAIYAHPPAAAVIVHDWIWRKRGVSRVVSVALLKRLNLIRW